MMCLALERLEGDFFRILNGVVEPLVRAGLGSPGPWPTGLIVLETQGRKTGRLISLPLLATLVADHVVVSTVRGRSQWVRNVAAAPAVRYWMSGRPHAGQALVVARGLAPVLPATPSPLARALSSGLLPFAEALGMAFAILTPAPAAGAA